MCSGVMFVRQSVEMFLYVLKERSTSTETIRAFYKSVIIVSEKLSISCTSLFPLKTFATLIKMMKIFFYEIY